MDQGNFTKSLARAQELMLNEEFNQKVERSANKFNHRSNNAPIPDVSAYSAQQTYEKVQQVPVQESKASRSAGSGLPTAILESLRNTPPMSGDEMNMMLPDELLPKAVQVNERVQPKSNPIPSSNGSVDYSIIKAIVNECLKEHDKKMLSESTLKGFKIGKGNKIQFVDSKGNLYEGVLTLKKRAQG